MLTLKQAENAFRSGAPPVDGDRTFEGFLYGYEPRLNEIVRKFLEACVRPGDVHGLQARLCGRDAGALE